MTLAMTVPHSPTHEELTWCAAQSRTPKLRTLRQFAEGEIVLPEGKYRGRKLRIHRQPYVGLLYDAIDSGDWSRTAIVGCIQAGKSLCGFVTPLFYHLFEHRETVICGIPTRDMASDKWVMEIYPALVASQYKRFLPRIGPGSRGGAVKDCVQFLNGAVLRFMTGGGGDETRSSFTSRVVVITETDKMDEARESSRETDPISQLENRMGSYDDYERRLYLECTASIPTGRIWREYQAGTQSRIVCPCPHCGEYVTPEREHLQGWQEAQSKLEAGRRAYFVCPACGDRINGKQRRDMNQAARLVHRGQTIDPDGAIHGDPPETDTLGFRWNAFNNLFWSIGAIAKKEWARWNTTSNEEEAEREIRQFDWALPAEPLDIDLTPLDPREVRQRTVALKKGIVPKSCTVVSIGCDTHKRHCEWVALASTDAPVGHIIDYGSFPVDCDTHGVFNGLLAAMRQWRDYLLRGWHDQTGQVVLPSIVWIDSGYFEHTDAVYEFCKTANAECGTTLFFPSKGYGTVQKRVTSYNAPPKTTQDIIFIGREYYVSRVRRVKGAKVFLAHVNADHWKSEVHQAFTIPAGDPGSLVLWEGSPNEHDEYSNEITAERKIEKYIPGKGEQVVWERIRRRNHKLDATYAAMAAGHYAIEAPKKRSGQKDEWFAARRSDRRR